jgi:hypothetical protein
MVSQECSRSPTEIPKKIPFADRFSLDKPHWWLKARIAPQGLPEGQQENSQIRGGVAVEMSAMVENREAES